MDGGLGGSGSCWCDCAGLRVLLCMRNDWIIDDFGNSLSFICPNQFQLWTSSAGIKEVE